MRAVTEALSEPVMLADALSDGHDAVADRDGQLALAVTLTEIVEEDDTVLLSDADIVALGDADALHHEQVAERLASGVALGHAEPEPDGDASGERDSVTL